MGMTLAGRPGRVKLYSSLSRHPDLALRPLVLQAVKMRVEAVRVAKKFLMRTAGDEPAVL